MASPYSPTLASTLPTLLLLLLAAANPATAGFKCSATTPRAKCRALVDYVSPNATTLSAIKTLFNIKKLNDLLGANDLEISSHSPSSAVAAKQRIRIPFPCACANGTGISDRTPVYAVKSGDTLDHIARDLFAGIVTFQEITSANGIPNPDKIEVDQNLTIPIPCSCDAVDGADVVHYGHVVEAHNSLEAIAATYGTTEDTLLKLNGMTNATDLKAEQVLDVPLKACSSSVRNDSLDSPLLVANGTYVVTAHQCVKCRCDSANNWMLKCEPSKLNSTQWSSCPSTQCNETGGPSLTIGSTTTTNVTCGGSTCAYAGYDNRTIFTALVSTCPASNNNSNGAIKMGMRAWDWNFLFVSLHLALLALALF